MMAPSGALTPSSDWLTRYLAMAFNIWFGGLCGPVTAWPGVLILPQIEPAKPAILSGSAADELFFKFASPATERRLKRRPWAPCGAVVGVKMFG